MNTEAKCMTWEQVAHWREQARTEGHRVVMTNGCFDLLHAGHVSYLEQARGLGDRLLVALNGDVSVRELKGPNRPVNLEWDRARVISGLACVDAVVIFPEKRATRILSWVKPDVYVKGGDYTKETMDRDERAEVEASGGEIHFLGFLPGRSTSQILERSKEG